MCQPIDAGIGATIKTLLSQVQDEWLDESGNLEAWEGEDNAPYLSYRDESFSAQDKMSSKVGIEVKFL